MKRSLFAFALLWAGVAQAGETSVAVASNFTEPATEIAALFAERTGHSAVLTFGASGQFYAQISQGAPFQVFLSADDARPRKAVEEGFGVEGTAFTYALGTLTLWSADPDLVKGEETLRAGGFEKIAIASPEAAPYGLAAVQTMEKLGVREALQPKIVQGSNISQALQFVDTGNAELGFVALSQVVLTDKGSRWIVPGELHDRIRQDAVLLEPGRENEAARAFLDFLRTPEARGVIERFGYGLDPQAAAG
jgi:molybdate transport system substrate-binding protein